MKNHQGKEQTVALPFAYPLLESKEEVAYSKVFEVTLEGSQRLGVAVRFPQYAMTDFKLAIMNAAWLNRECASMFLPSAPTCF